LPPAVTKPKGYENWRTVSEIAKYVGVSTRTVERWWKEEKLPEPFRFGNQGTKLWSPEQCAALLVQQIGRLPSSRASERRITRR
jgi:excisionase family DNA binding protein